MCAKRKKHWRGGFRKKLGVIAACAPFWVRAPVLPNNSSTIPSDYRQNMSRMSTVFAGVVSLRGRG